MLNRLVASVLVVVAVIVRAAYDTVYFLGVLSDKEYVTVVEDLVMLERGQLLHVVLHGRLGTHGLNAARLLLRRVHTGLVVGRAAAAAAGGQIRLTVRLLVALRGSGLHERLVAVHAVARGTLGTV